MGKVGQGIAHVQRFGPEGLFAGEGEELPHQRGCPIGVLINLDQIAEIRIALVMAQQEEVAMAGNCGQKVVEIMRHTAG